MKISVVALVIAIIAFVGMAAHVIQMADVSHDVREGLVRENYIQIQYLDERVLDRALLTEDQRQIGLYLVRRNDGSVALLCANGTFIARFDVDTSVSKVRYEADVEMMKYWIGTSECRKATGE